MVFPAEWLAGSVTFVCLGFQSPVELASLHYFVIVVPLPLDPGLLAPFSNLSSQNIINSLLVRLQQCKPACHAKGCWQKVEKKEETKLKQFNVAFISLFSFTCSFSIFPFTTVWNAFFGLFKIVRFVSTILSGKK